MRITSDTPNQVWPAQIQTPTPGIGAVSKDIHQILSILFLLYSETALPIWQHRVLILACGKNDVFLRQVWKAGLKLSM